MSSLTMEPSYMPVEYEAKRPPQQIANEKLALVIPTLNEAASLRGLLERTLHVLDRIEIPCELLVVDDDSRDGTYEVVSAIAADDPRVRLMVRKDRKGLAGAILHGWASTDAGILGVMDGDLQHPPELLPDLLAALLEGQDLVIGSRYARGGKRGEWNPIRRLISAIAIMITLPLQHPWLKTRDPMSGYFLVRRECVQEVAFRPTGFKLLLEILVRGRVRSVMEIPIAFGRRSAGKSKASLGVAWEYLQLLMELYASRTSDARVAQAELSGD